MIVGWRAASWKHMLGFPQSCSCVSEFELPDLARNSRDLVIHALSLHWSNDPVGQLILLGRVLRPDGFMIAVLFGGQTLIELRTALAAAEARVGGGLSPRVAPMAEIRDLGNLLSRAGLALPVADSVKLQVHYTSPIRLMHDLRAMGETNAILRRRKSFFRRSILMAAVEYYEENFAVEAGQVVATFEFIFLSSWAPDASHPSPLRPGSATTRLADVLGTEEFGPDGMR